uniref:Uncharacterized protein n=1 Tax=Arundo donax TaxID=35708 RepID=A0A0A9BPI2_ARUDO
MVTFLFFSLFRPF